MRGHLIALTTVAAGLTACGPAPGTAPPALTKAQAARVLAHYESVNNRANAALDGDLLGTVETGAQLDMDRAGYRLRRVTKARYAAFDYASPVYYIPRETGFPKWFAVDAVTGATRHALLFVQERRGAPWLLTADPFPSAPLRDVVLDRDGYAAAVSLDDTHTALPPGRVAAAHAAALGQGASGMGTGPYTTGAHTALVKVEAALRRKGVTLDSRFVPDRQRAFALRTTGGGALVWYVVRQTESYAVPKAGLIGGGGDLTGLISGTVRHHLNTTALIQYLAVVPAHGAPRVIGTYRKAVQAEAA